MQFYRVIIGYVAWQKITGQLSRINLILRRYLFFEHIRRKETKPAEKEMQVFHAFHRYYFTGESELVWSSPGIVTLES